MLREKIAQIMKKRREFVAPSKRKDAKGQRFPWWARKRKEPWLKAEAVKKVRITTRLKDGRPAVIGEGVVGSVYHGKLYFNQPDGRISKHNVAIKVFKTPISDERAREYEELIDDLRKTGYPIPKTGMYKLRKEDAKEFEGVRGAKPGMWIQIQQFFGPVKTGIIDREEEHVGLSAARRAEGKFGMAAGPVMWSGRPKAKEDAIYLLTRLGNIGYHPASDAVAPLRERRKDSIAFDLDNITKVLYKEAGPDIAMPVTAETITGSLISDIELIGETPRERRKLLNLSIKYAEPSLKAKLEEVKKWIFKKDGQWTLKKK